MSFSQQQICVQMQPKLRMVMIVPRAEPNAVSPIDMFRWRKSSVKCDSTSGPGCHGVHDEHERPEYRNSRHVSQAVASSTKVILGMMKLQTDRIFGTLGR